MEEAKEVSSKSQICLPLSTQVRGNEQIPKFYVNFVS